MKRLWLPLVVLAAWLPVFSPNAAQPAGDTVVVDAVAVDERGQPVDGLTAADFKIRDDGAMVTADSVEEIGANGHAAPRTVVLLLDDTATEARLTDTVQTIAQSVVTRATPGDDVTVVRLNARGDEATGGPAVALSRIHDYRGESTPFFGRETFETVLHRVTALSRKFDREGDEPRRRTILAIGSPFIVDVREPLDGKANLLWPAWIEALGTASRALVNVSAIDPAGVTGRVKLIGARALVERTGGSAHYNNAAFDAAIADVWRDAGHYYLLSFTTPRSGAQLHDLDITAARSGVRVRARRVHG